MQTQSEELRFLLKHSTIYGLGNVLSRAVAFLMLPLYTHYLTPTDYGMLELLETTTGLIGIVAGLGISASVSRFYYERETEPERQRLISTVFLTIGFGTSGLLVFAHLAAPLLAWLVLNDRAYAWYFQLAFINLLLGVFVDVGLSYLRMLYKSVLFITLSTLTLVVGVTLNVIFISQLHYGVLSILYTSFIVRIMVGVPLTASILKRNGVRYSLSDARALLRYSLPILPATLGNALLNYSDRYFIKSFVSLADAGVYGLANKVGSILHTLITGPFISTFQPRRFQLAHERADVKQVLQTVFDSFFLVLLSLSLIVAIYSRDVMMMMTAPAFHAAADLIPVLLLANLLFAMKYHVDFGIFQSGKTQYYMWANVMTAAVQLTAAFFLIRAFGMWGAAYAIVLSTTVNVILLHAFANRLYPIDFNFGRCLRTLAFAILVYLTAAHRFTDDVTLTLLLKTASVAAYLVLLPVLGLISREELHQALALTRSFIKRVPIPSAARS